MAFELKEVIKQEWIVIHHSLTDSEGCSQKVLQVAEEWLHLGPMLAY